MDIGYVVSHDNDSCGPYMAKLIDAQFIALDIHKFSDGETKYTIPQKLRDENVVFFSRNTRPFQDPDAYTMKNYRILRTIKNVNPKRLVLVMPYFHFARQDKRFLPGESSSLKYTADIYELCEVDEMIIINSHLYGKKDQRDMQSFFQSTIIHDLSPAKAFADYLKTNDMVDEDIVVVGPDEGAIKMIKEMASYFEKGEYVYIKQNRDHKTGHKKVSEVPIDMSKTNGRDVFVYDDIVSSGKTTKTGRETSKECGAENVYGGAVHFVSQDTAKILVDAGFDEILYTNSLMDINPNWPEYVQERLHEIDIMPIIAEHIINKMQNQ